MPAPAAPPSQRRERADLSARLRAAGQTWPQVAEAFRSRYRVNARVAMRLAHGWSQREVAERWTSAWPDDLKTLKHISYWEQWPAATGHEPGLRTLANLARLYECSAGDLLADLGDYRHTDSAASAAAASGVQSVLAGLAWPLSRHAPADMTELAQAVTMWGRQLSPDLDRRALLFSLSGAFALAAAAPVFEKITSDRQLYAGEPGARRRLDGAALDRAEAIIADCRRHGDVLGPAVTLQCVMAEREVLAAVLRDSPPAALAGRAQSAYAELSQLAGWLLFNLGDLRGAAHYYEEARTVAHAAQDTDLVTYVLCTMSHMATWAGQPRTGIDHAVAAQTWARRAGNPLALAYAADVTARACAADNAPPGDCDAALALEQEAISTAPAGRVPDRWYFYDESFRLGTMAETSLLLSRPAAALEAAGRSLALIDPGNLHNQAMTQALHAEAVIRQGDGPRACALIASIARETVGNSSSRIDNRVTSLRRELGPWAGTTEVRDLDEQLRLYRRPA